MFENDPFEHCAFMKTPKGEIITQWNLHDIEYMGCTKYDFLVTEVQDKIVQTLRFLQEDGQIDPSLSLREIYDKYLHPSILPIDDPRIWDALDNNKVLNVFQFDSIEGSKAARQLQPRSILLSGIHGCPKPIVREIMRQLL
jgi:DNA polymerase III alpha subunit